MMGGGQFPLTTAEVIATMLRTSPAEQSSPVLTVRYPSCPQSNMPLRPSMVEFSMVSRSAWRPMWRVLSFSKKANSIHYQLRQCQSQSQSPGVFLPGQAVAPAIVSMKAIWIGSSGANSTQPMESSQPKTIASGSSVTSLTASSVTTCNRPAQEVSAMQIITEHMTVAGF